MGVLIASCTAEGNAPMVCIFRQKAYQGTNNCACRAERRLTLKKDTSNKSWPYCTEDSATIPNTFSIDIKGSSYHPNLCIFQLSQM